MDNNKPFRPVLLFAVCAALFVWQTSESLPPMVASHFALSGTANGFMPRTLYILFMLAFVKGLPTLTNIITQKASGNPKALLNLPNLDYWLAPARRSETISFLRTCFSWFSILLVSFPCFAHWLVVLANRSQPAHLAGPWFLSGLGIFGVAVFIWVKVIRGHFST